MRNAFLRTAIAAAISVCWANGTLFGQAPAGSVPTREDAVVDSATEVLGQVMAIPAQSIPAGLLAKAEGVAVIPGMIKGGFIVGVRHGRGVIAMRDETGRWRPPAMVEVTGASVGWQAGVQGTDLVLVFCTKRSLQDLIRGKFTIGANASAAAGPVGRDAQAATDARLKAEIYSYSRSRGLFAGLALDGAVLSIDNTATTAYYRPAAGAAAPGQPGQPGQAGQAVATPPSAVRFQQQLSKYAPAGKVAPADLQTLRTQLAESSRKLEAILDPTWRTYLALPAEIQSGDRAPAADALRTPRDRFAAVAADPQYQTLAQRAEFQNTWSLLKKYSESLQSAGPQPLNLPPPPK